MDTTHPCTCQGNNEWCYKCDGTGYVSRGGEDRTLKASGVLYQRSVRGRSKKGRSLAAPTTGVLAPPHALVRLPEGAETPPYLVRDGVQYTLCMRCGYHAPSAHFTVHNEICAGRRPRPQPRPIPPPRPVVRSQHAGRPLCPECGNPVNPENLARHRRRVHGLSAAASSSLPVPAPLPAASQSSVSLLRSGAVARYQLRNGVGYAQCGACGKEVRSERFGLHSYICPGVPGAERSTRSPRGAEEVAAVAPATNDGARMISCPVCGCRLQTSNLERHQRRAHRPCDIAAAGAIAPVADKPRVTRGRVSATPALEGILGDHAHRDATRHIGSLARDHGQFGSMPAYDDYGDEGVAD